MRALSRDILILLFIERFDVSTYALEIITRDNDSLTIDHQPNLLMHLTLYLQYIFTQYKKQRVC